MTAGQRAHVTPLEGVVPAVFESREQAEAALGALREIGFNDDALGILVPDPERYHLVDKDMKDMVHYVGTGGIFGIPLGAVAGLGVATLVVPGLGLIGVGGALLWGTVGGALWGAYLGATVGMAAEIRHVEDIERRYEIPLEPHEVLIVVLAGEQAKEICDLMEKQGAHCYWEVK